MSAKTKATFGALFIAVWGAACSAGGRLESSNVGVAAEPWCSGYYVNHVVAREGTAILLSPDHLAQSTEAWGPQALSLSVEHDFSAEVSYQASPSVSRERDKITKSLQAALSFSLSDETDLSATNTVLVPTDAYYRLEAYPEYQVVDFDVRQDPCGPTGDVLLTTGSVYRPIGIYFRVMVYVGGEWNALTPPSPSVISLPPRAPTPALPTPASGIHDYPAPSAA
jgi:hypothetical protein